MTERMRVIVADDERPARAYLTSLLRRRPDIDIVGEAETGVEAVGLIERERPDLAFLDLQMPELDGLGVVRVLKRKVMPLIVFVTAYEEHALGAFELNAVDYLLKPASPGSSRRGSVSRVRQTRTRGLACVGSRPGQGRR